MEVCAAPVSPREIGEFRFMNPEPHSGLIFRWIRSTFLGWTAGFASILVFVAVAGLVGLGAAQFPVGLGMGAGVGLLQSRLSMFPLVARRAWVTSSALGMAAPFVVFDVAGLIRAPVEYSLPISVAIGGVVVGVWQSILLRRTSRRASLWTFSSAVGWSLAGATALNNLFLPRIPGLTGAMIYVAVVLLGGVVLGVIGGAALRAILSGSAADSALAR